MNGGKEGNMVFRNLQAEMVRRNVTPIAISKSINKTEKSTRAKLDGKFPFTFQEAKIVRDTFFPGMDLDFLFQSDNTQQ